MAHMAAALTISQTVLQINYKTGQNSSGKDLIKSDKFQKINPSASNDDVLSVGTAIGGLLMYPVVSVERVDSGVLTNQ